MLGSPPLGNPPLGTPPMLGAPPSDGVPVPRLGADGALTVGLTGAGTAPVSPGTGRSSGRTPCMASRRFGSAVPAGGCVSTVRNTLGTAPSVRRTTEPVGVVTMVLPAAAFTQRAAAPAVGRVQDLTDPCVTTIVTSLPSMPNANCVPRTPMTAIGVRI